MSLHGEDIGNVLASEGPIVKGVLLRHISKTGRDEKPHPVSPKKDDQHQRHVLVDLIDEVQVDTTPTKGHIKELVGGPFTFVGQFESEGTMVIAKREIPEDVSDLSIKELRLLCNDLEIDIASMKEKQELVAALEAEKLPYNPHQLQPPLSNLAIRGDILLIKVAETKEELDEEGADEATKLEMLPNDQFFLDYTKKEYVEFASRTDIPEPKSDDEEEEEEGEEEISDDDEEEDETYEVGEEGIDEDEANTVLNLIMGEVLRKFREENGRGPNTHELLELRSQVAANLGVQVPTAEEIEGKRPAEEKDHDDQPHEKKVKFTSPPDDDQEDSKPAAKEADKKTNGDKKEG